MNKYGNNPPQINPDLAADSAKLEPTRCAVCGWPIGGDDAHCKPGNCSMRPLPTPVEPQRAIAEYGSLAPEEWFRIKPHERTYSESEVIAREQRLVQVVVERAAEYCDMMAEERYGSALEHVPYLHITRYLRQLSSPENVASLIKEANARKD